MRLIALITPPVIYKQTSFHQKPKKKPFNALFTGSMSMYVSCAVLIGLKPITSVKKAGSPFKKCGGLKTRGAPSAQPLKSNTPLRRQMPLSFLDLVQKHSSPNLACFLPFFLFFQPTLGAKSSSSKRKRYEVTFLT